jgi:hypothetical protein
MIEGEENLLQHELIIMLSSVILHQNSMFN